MYLTESSQGWGEATLKPGPKSARGTMGAPFSDRPPVTDPRYVFSLAVTSRRGAGLPARHGVQAMSRTTDPPEEPAIPPPGVPDASSAPESLALTAEGGEGRLHGGDRCQDGAADQAHGPETHPEDEDELSPRRHFPPRLISPIERPRAESDS